MGLIRTGALGIHAFVAGFGLTFAVTLSGSCAFADDSVNTGYFGGVAIMGYDTVAYFTDATAILGVVDFEVREGGAVWRFRNEGNRASFIAHPEIYGPQSSMAESWPWDRRGHRRGLTRKAQAPTTPSPAKARPLSAVTQS